MKFSQHFKSEPDAEVQANRSPAAVLRDEQAKERVLAKADLEQMVARAEGWKTPERPSTPLNHFNDDGVEDVVAAIRHRQAGKLRA
eukprot:CAMPEP_0204381280 /NCGR_PEP_ID=MMETSP0469-20131031/54097_1 /ASSEMBLY_ACC=CAM_ASM_000384 /TAXON_ID=2969 /ORGANISM="Oxyrrhis marina" /LENGTH=85 /DNA_ID=CAMNT_0051373091 /DNA_START=23 /DNA_END=280 /DNA_ORIENTATION=+